LLNPGAPGRVAADWQSATSFTINVDLTDGRPHYVSLTWLTTARAPPKRASEVLNAANNAVLSAPITVSNFAGGEYLTWALGAM